MSFLCNGQFTGLRRERLHDQRTVTVKPCASNRRRKAIDDQRFTQVHRDCTQKSFRQCRLDYSARCGPCRQPIRPQPGSRASCNQSTWWHAVLGVSELGEGSSRGKSLRHLIPTSPHPLSRPFCPRLLRNLDNKGVMDGHLIAPDAFAITFLAPTSPMPYLLTNPTPTQTLPARIAPTERL